MSHRICSSREQAKVNQPPNALTALAEKVPPFISLQGLPQRGDFSVVTRMDRKIRASQEFLFRRRQSNDGMVHWVKVW